MGTGRFVLLHDPSAPAAWQADTRLVVYVETDIDSEMAEDQLLTDVGWAWLQECLAAAEVPYAALGGTVTAVRSTSFEALSARGHETSIQIRASWSALGLEALDDHFSVWIALMEMCAGLPVLSRDRADRGDLVGRHAMRMWQVPVREVALHNPMTKLLIRKDSRGLRVRTTLAPPIAIRSIR